MASICHILPIYSILRRIWHETHRTKTEGRLFRTEMLKRGRIAMAANWECSDIQDPELQGHMEMAREGQATLSRLKEPTGMEDLT